MRNIFKSKTISTGLAIFAMLFGAGNLIYPLLVGLTAGDKTLIGILAFIMSAVCLPVFGLISMILFDGDYKYFFNRLGNKIGAIFIFISMLIIGPIIAIPRIVTLSHTMIAPFIPIPMLQQITPYSSCIFGILFLSITFVCTFRKNKIIDVIGQFISPLLLISLIIIIVKGLLTAEGTYCSTQPALDIFKENIRRGYETLDLFGGLFFSSIILNILKKGQENNNAMTTHRLALIGLQAGIIGTILLGLVYIGMSYLGASHGQGINYFTNAGELFRAIAFNILGPHGAALIGTTVFMACLSTAIALGAVVGNYLQQEIFKNKIGFIPSLLLVLIMSLPLATAGLTHVLNLTGGPITYIGYPILIIVTLCNITYKLFGFKPIKVPVAVTFIIALISYFW